MLSYYLIYRVLWLKIFSRQSCSILKLTFESTEFCFGLCLLPYLWYFPLDKHKIFTKEIQLCLGTTLTFNLSFLCIVVWTTSSSSRFYTYLIFELRLSVKSMMWYFVYDWDWISCSVIYCVKTDHKECAFFLYFQSSKFYASFLIYLHFSEILWWVKSSLVIEPLYWDTFMHAMLG